MMKYPSEAALLVDDLEIIRENAKTLWGVKLSEAILKEARSFGRLDGDDLADWPTADLVAAWAWDSRSDEIERIGDNRDAFIVAMGSVRRSQRIRRELFPLATAAALFPQENEIRESALRYWRAPLYFRRWQYPGYTLYYKENAMSADGDGEWGATENYLVTLPACAELLAPWVSDDELILLRRRTAEFCSRIEDDFYTGRSWFFDGLDGGTPAGNQFTQIIGGLAVGALSLLGHDPRADRWVSLSSEQLVRSMDATGADGSYFEGAAYGLGTMEQVWMTAFLLDRKGDSRLIEHPQVKNFPYWLMDTFLPDYDGWVPLNDSGGSLSRESLYNRRRNWAALVLEMSATRSRDANITWCLHEIAGGPSCDAFGLLCYDSSVRPTEPNATGGAIKMAPSSSWRLVEKETSVEIPFGNDTSAAGTNRRVVHYPEQGIVIARTGFEKESVMVVLKGGYSCRGHDHNDRNSFLVYDGPIPIITETGPGPYSDPEFDLHFGSHHAHSTIQVDRETVSHGSAAIGVEGVTVSIDRDDGELITATAEASASYPTLSIFERVLEIRLPDSIDIVDRIVPVDDCEREIAFWFHSNARAALVDDGTAVLIPGYVESMWRLSVGDPALRFVSEYLGGEGADDRTAWVVRRTIKNEELSVRFKLVRIE
jgi:hypothetical protein